MSIVKILINNTQNDLQILNRVVSPSGEYEIPSNHWLDLRDKIVEQEEIYTQINDGDIIVNNGTTNLSVADGLVWCTKLDYTDPIGQISGYGFQAVFIENGTASDEWLQHYGQNIISNQTPYIIPFDCQLVGITYSNKNSGVDAHIEVWVSTIGDGTTKTRVLNWQINNKRIGYKTNFNPYIEFDAGDKISIFNEDVGTNANDVTVILYFRAINNNTNEEFENYSGDQGSGGTS